MKAVNKWGMCRETVWPYYPPKVNMPPSKDAYVEAIKHIFVNYYSLDNENLIQMKKCLYFKSPFIFGATLYESFMGSDTAKSGIVAMPQKDERTIGGHAMCCVGYDDHKQAFIVRNSWGIDWGDHGYCYIPYDYLTNTNLASDFWTLRKD
jgi:C1A family cysteine protease